MTKGEIICILENVSNSPKFFVSNENFVEIKNYAKNIEEILPDNIPESIIDKFRNIQTYLDNIKSYYPKPNLHTQSEIIVDNTIESWCESIQFFLKEIFEYLSEYYSKKIVYSFNDIKKRKEEFDQKISELLKLIEEETKELETKIAGYNRIALAEEFINRRKELEKSRWWYFGLFIAGLAGIVALGLWIIPILVIQKTPNTQEIMPILTQLVSKLFLMGPVVWLTWFFAKQYANTNRLAEDYVFKATTALAYKGYEEKAKDDIEMKKELLRTAIRTFGDNPTRLLSKNECTSPLNEAIQLIDLAGKLKDK